MAGHDQRDRIRQGSLVIVLDELTAPPATVHLVYQPSRLMAPKLRAFIDFAAPRLKRALDDMQVP